MLYTIQELGMKNVVNLCDGKILGNVCDIELNADCGKAAALIVSGNRSVFSLCAEIIRISWDDVKCVGEDTILVEYKHECNADARVPGKKHGWLFGIR